MFERFTDQARRVVVLAQEEARLLNHNYIGTEHLLLGLVHDGEGAPAEALESLGIGLELVRQQVEEIIGRGKHAPSGHIPFTPRAKKVLELSLREALQLGHNYIGAEHILLGLVREGEGVAAQVLVRLGAGLDRVREEVIKLAHGEGGAGEGGAEATASRGSRFAMPGRRDRATLAGLHSRLNSIESRLAAIERRVGTGADDSDLEQEMARLRREKEAAIEAQDFERAATLRDQEKQLEAEKKTRQREWAETHPDLPSVSESFRRLSEEVQSLHDLLRQHGIEPEEGTA